jgi:hypothetical protein
VIAHLVLFRPRPDLTDGARRDLAEAFTAAARAIPSVRRVRVGRRVTHGRPYEQLMRSDLQYAALFEFDDLAGLRSYLDHPSHEALASRFFDAFEEALMYDYDLNEDAEAAQRLL